MVGRLPVTSFLVELVNADFEDPTRNGTQEEGGKQAKETSYRKDGATIIGYVQHYYG